MTEARIGTDPRCIAIIPARGGSKGIPRKNVRLVGGIPLVGHSILAARSSKRVAAVYVSTDDPEIAETATRYGAQVIDRPPAIAGDVASSEDALLHGLDVLQSQGIAPEILVFLQCTSPLTTPDGIDQVVAALDDPRFASAFSVAEDHGFLWGIAEDGDGYGVNHNHAAPRVRRQDLAPQYRETGAVYAMRVGPFVEQRNRFCGKARPVALDLPVVEVDSLEDLKVIEALLSARTDDAQKRTPPPPGIKVLVTDFDGVHTDDCVYVDENGRESVRCSRSDGMGIEMLRKAGFQVLILSKESNPVVSARARKLGVHVIQQCDDKKTTLQTWAAEQNFLMRELAYVGNDINDVACLATCGWSCCPSDAHVGAQKAAQYKTTARGGTGAIREIAEKLLESVGMEKFSSATGEFPVLH